MSYNVVTIPPFDRQLKRLVKKYPSLKVEYAELVDSLEENPEQGNAMYNNCYKYELPLNLKAKENRAKQGL